MKNISLFTLVEIALKHIFIIIAAALVFAVGTFCYCEFIAVPQYSATGNIMITNGGIITGNSADDGDDSTLNNADIQASINIVNSIESLLNKKPIFTQLSEELGNKYSAAALQSYSTVTKEASGNLFIDVKFTANTREEAIEFVNTYLSLVPDYIAEKGPKSVETSTFPADSASKVYPRTLVTTAISAVVGAVIAYAVLFLIYCANTVIKGEDDFKDRFQLPVLGCIPDFATAKGEKYYKKYNYSSKGGKKGHGK